MQRGVHGAKPEEFCCWLFEVLNVQDSDEFVDYPGSGAVTRAFNAWRSQLQLVSA